VLIVPVEEQMMEEPVDPEEKKMPAKEERSTPGHVDQT
jgi:hypothetical protein